ncbi:MAG: MerR family transcriptional regulator [Acidobacteria bacterium]|nr:MAG: MerR family transcriptional regulator [Acidobacteriota bacterium]
MSEGQTPGHRRREAARGLYMISVAAELAGVHPQTLRTYERRGLLTPRRSAGNTRKYSDEDIKRLERIKELAETGLNLAGIRVVLDMDDRVTELAGQLEKARAELKRAREAVADEVAAVHSQYRRELVPFQPHLPARRTTA